MQPQTLTIPKNAQATAGEVRIGAGNIWEEEYTDGAGQKRQGLTAGLWLSFKDDPSKNDKRRVYPGEVFAIGKYRFEVKAIEAGSVTVIVGPGNPAP